MKIIRIILLLLIPAVLISESLFQVKDNTGNVVMDISTDGLRVLNGGDTLMVISSSEIKAYIQQDAVKGLSRSFSVTSTSSRKTVNKVFEIATDEGATFYNPSDNTDEIFSISKSGITANVNPALNRDFVVNDEVSSNKGSGNLMKISNEALFEAINDSTMLWYKDKNAFRIGYVLINSDAEVGRGSFASGYQSQASGKFASSIGYKASASGEASFASGRNSLASGQNAAAIGNEATASGTSSFAIGYNTEASGTSSFAGGSSTSASGLNSCAVGALASASDEYACALGALAVANQYGATAVGIGAWATGSNSVALGSGARASNTYAATMSSRGAEASGYGSAAIGYYTDAIGSYSTALGYYSNANGTYSTAAGYRTEASGYYSSAFGRYTESRAYASTVVGSYNTLDGNSTSWANLDPIFVVGNGTSSTSRSDALVVQKNGAVFIPSLYNATSGYSIKDLKVDSRGKLCVAGKEDNGYDDEDILRLIKENEELKIKMKEQDERLKRLENMISEIRNK